MKIDILQQPAEDIFKNRPKLIMVFTTLLFIAVCGILIGVYTIFNYSVYNDQLETLALILFVAPSPIATFFGEKLQQYKKLIPPQQEKLRKWRQQYPEVETYCSLVEKMERPMIRGEYEACKIWAENN